MQVLQRNTRLGFRSPHQPGIPGTLWYDLGLSPPTTGFLQHVTISAVEVITHSFTVVEIVTHSLDAIEVVEHSFTVEDS